MTSKQILLRLGAFTGLVLIAHGLSILFGLTLYSLTHLSAQTTLPFFAAILTLGASGAIIRHFDRMPLAAIGIGFDRPWIKQVVIGTLVGAALITLAWLIFGWAGWRTSGPAAADGDRTAKLIVAFIFCVAIAVYEEVICRGYVLQIIAGRSPRAAIILTGVLFLCFHLPNEGGRSLMAMINLLLAHLMFTVCYLKTRSLWLPIGLHVGWNFAEAFVFGMSLSGHGQTPSLLSTELTPNLWTGNVFGPESGLMATVIFAVVTVVVWWGVRQRHPSPDLMSAGSVAEDQWPTPALETGTLAGRMLAMDVLRGAAILAILPFNMQLFSMIDGAFHNPYAGDFTDPTNVTIWVLLNVLIGHKDLAVFGILFGAGITMIAASRQARGESSAATHYRRMLVLLVFGFIHAYALFPGDILYTYAMCGFIVYLFHRFPARSLIIMGGLAYAVPMCLLIVANEFVPRLRPELAQEIYSIFRPTAEQIVEYNKTLGGTWLEQMSYRARASFGLQTLGLLGGMGWVAGGMMLVGMGLYKLGILTGQFPDRTYTRMILAAVLVGLPLSILGLVWHFVNDWQPDQSFFLGWFWRESAQPIIAIGWIGLIVLICRYGKLSRLTGWLSAIGQMALTNYIMHSVICSFLFHGHGLGLVGKVDLVGILLITLAIWVFQVIVSVLWLRRFRFGPVEWLWRTLAYGKRPPMLKRPAAG